MWTGGGFLSGFRRNNFDSVVSHTRNAGSRKFVRTHKQVFVVHSTLHREGGTLSELLLVACWLLLLCVTLRREVSAHLFLVNINKHNLLVLTSAARAADLKEANISHYLSLRPLTWQRAGR